jgi:NADH dehydrogenase FAD-containing subunit
MKTINFNEINNIKDFLSVDEKTAISAHGEIFNIGDLVEHEDDGGVATIQSFELDKQSNDVRANTEKGWAS